MSYYFAMFTPYYLLDIGFSFSTMPYTMAFSNTPGCLKPVIFEGDKKTIKVQNYVIPARYTGLAISAISYVNYFKICLTVDDSIMKDPEILLSLVEKNLKMCYAPTNNSEESSATSTVSPPKIF